MTEKKRIHPAEKSQLHERNLHRSRYDLKMLAQVSPELDAYIIENEYGDESIRFSDPLAVKALNKALLKHYYQIENWDIPAGYLCPPVPGRADYIHYLADLLATDKSISQDSPIRILDIGAGAGCIYPLLGHKAYSWSFIGSEIDGVALASAKRIVESNKEIQPFIELRKQDDNQKIFEGILQKDETITATICNPPFHASAQEASRSAMRKTRNLGHDKKVLNFGGQQHELWCEGGEVKFIERMIAESLKFKTNCRWFTTLVSQEAHLDDIYRALEIAEPSDVKTIAMGQGNKVSRIVAWRY